MPSMIRPRTPIFTALVASSSPKAAFTTLPCVFITTISPGTANEMALCNIRLSPEWHQTVSAEPTILGDRQMGLMPASMAPNRDMQSAACALAAIPNASSSACPGRGQGVRTRNPTLPGIVHLHHSGAGGRNAGAGRRGKAECAKGILEVQQIGENIVSVDIAHGPDANHFPLDLVARAGDHGAMALVHIADNIATLEAIRYVEADDGARKPLRLWEGAEPQSLATGAQGGGHHAMPREYLGQSLFMNHFQGFAKAGHQRYWSGERGARFLHRRHGLAEVPVVSRQPVVAAHHLPSLWAHTYQAQAGRTHQRLLRGRGDDIDAPFVLTHFDTAQPADGIDYQ